MPPTRAIEEVQRLKTKGLFIIKPRRGRGSRDVFTVDHKSFAGQCGRLPPGKFLVQDFIDGHEVSVDALYNREGHLLELVARKRLKTDSGICVIGETVPLKPFVKAIERLSRSLRLVGGVCFQFLGRKDKYYLTDINPRLGGGVDLSLKASPSFRNNLLGLIRGEGPLRKVGYGKYKTMSMYRHYYEVFRH
jgi:carbamoyl-phosphate synthase large subunit